MFRTIVLLASFIGASAFAPAGKVAVSSSLKMGFEDELGVLPPVGFFDPLGLSNSIDQSRFDRWRAVEIKHGRVSMAAVVSDREQSQTHRHGRTLQTPNTRMHCRHRISNSSLTPHIHTYTQTGLVAAELGRWPGYIAPGDGLKFADVPNGVAAIGSIPFLGWAQIILFVGWLETAVFVQDAKSAPGDFGTGYITEFGRKGSLSGEKKAEKLTKELQVRGLYMSYVISNYWDSDPIPTYPHTYPLLYPPIPLTPTPSLNPLSMLYAV
jgi:hypothetical protein